MICFRNNEQQNSHTRIFYTELKQLLTIMTDVNHIIITQGYYSLSSFGSICNHYIVDRPSTRIIKVSLHHRPHWLTSRVRFFFRCFHSDSEDTIQKSVDHSKKNLHSSSAINVLHFNRSLLQVKILVQT